MHMIPYLKRIFIKPGFKLMVIYIFFLFQQTIDFSQGSSRGFPIINPHFGINGGVFRIN